MSDQTEHEPPKAVEPDLPGRAAESAACAADVGVDTELDRGARGPRAKEGLATVYLCERGHHTFSVWSEPPTACPTPISSHAACGRPVYHSTELPEQVQKALNPLKASKKSSKS